MQKLESLPLFLEDLYDNAIVDIITYLSLNQNHFC